MYDCVFINIYQVSALGGNQMTVPVMLQYDVNSLLFSLVCVAFLITNSSTCLNKFIDERTADP